MNKTLTIAIATGSEVVSQTVPITGGEGSIDRDVVVPASTTDMLVEMQFRAAALKVIYILSDKTITLETNHNDPIGENPDVGNAITITANQPFFWYLGSGIANPFTFDVNDFRLTKAGATDATVKIRGLKDATP